MGTRADGGGAAAASAAAADGGTTRDACGLAGDGTGAGASADDWSGENASSAAHGSTPLPHGLDMSPAKLSIEAVVCSALPDTAAPERSRSASSAGERNGPPPCARLLGAGLSCPSGNMPPP